MSIYPDEIWLQGNLRLDKPRTVRHDARLQLRGRNPGPTQRPNNSIPLSEWLREVFIATNSLITAENGLHLKSDITGLDEDLNTAHLGGLLLEDTRVYSTGDASAFSMEFDLLKNFTVNTTSLFLDLPSNNINYVLTNIGINGEAEWVDPNTLIDPNLVDAENGLHTKDVDTANPDDASIVHLGGPLLENTDVNGVTNTYGITFTDLLLFGAAVANGSLSLNSSSTQLTHALSTLLGVGCTNTQLAGSAIVVGDGTNATIALQSAGINLGAPTVANNFVWTLVDFNTGVGEWTDVTTIPGVGECIWDVTANVTSNTGSCSDPTQDSWVVGSPSLDYDAAQSSYARRMFFDKPISAFRGGYEVGTKWDTRSPGSFQWGTNITENGSAQYHVAFGVNHIITGTSSGAFAGTDNVVDGTNAVCIGGNNNQSTGQGSVIVGGNNNTSGTYVFCAGRGNSGQAYASISLGHYPTLDSSIVALDQTVWSGNNRALVVGNGASGGARADAFSVLQSGESAFGIDDFAANNTGQKLQVNGTVKHGGQVMGRTEVNGVNYTVLTSDRVILVKSIVLTTGDTITLPSLTADDVGQVFTIKVAFGTIATPLTNNLNVVTAGAETIDGDAAGVILTNHRDGFTVQWDGSDYDIISTI